MWAVPPSAGLDAWLYQADPVEGCDGCARAIRRLAAAEEAGDQTARYEASREVRAHPRHQEERGEPSAARRESQETGVDVTRPGDPRS
ncbi:hypothetical protein ACGFW5_30225 [Streptomyces sp. NPDC048416]|uniref:hypothetical protein n=1 Tax=Streptomyces sp. NPDC048416 TaxID=3365546 RepID=UPI00371A93C8